MTAEEVVHKFEGLGGKFRFGPDGLPRANYRDMGMDEEETKLWIRIFGRHRDRIIEIMQQRQNQ